MIKTLLKIILLLIIITSISYVLLCQCKKERFELKNIDLSYDLLKVDNSVGIFENELECMDNVKLNVLKKNGLNINNLTYIEKQSLNKTAKDMCEHNTCDSNMCVYKKTDNIPPLKIQQKTFHVLIQEGEKSIELSWLRPDSFAPINSYICIIENLDSPNIPIKIQILVPTNLDIIKHTIKNLKLETNYRISIISENTYGESEPTSITIFIPNINKTPSTTRSYTQTQTSKPTLSFLNNTHAIQQLSGTDFTINVFP